MSQPNGRGPGIEEERPIDMVLFCPKCGLQHKRKDLIMGDLKEVEGLPGSVTATPKSAATYDRASLESLLARVEAATGPDRKLDAIIGLATGELRWGEKIGAMWTTEVTGRGSPALYRIAKDGVAEFGGLSDDIITRHYTASIDAALALVERVLPGWCVLMAVTGTRTVCDIHTKPLGDPSGLWPGHAEAPTAPLAILAALLKALLAAPISRQRRRCRRDAS